MRPKLWTLMAVAMAASAAAAAPLPVLVHPGQGRSPAVQSAPPVRESDVQGALDLMACLSAIAQGRLAEGEEYCSAALKFDPMNVTALKLRGYGYLLGHDYAKAETDLRAAMRLRSDDDEILAGYAESLSGQGKFTGSLPFFRKALLLAPGNATYWSAECWARAGTGKDLAIALQHCDRAIALAPGTAGPLNSRGLVHLRMGQNAAALQDYDRSLKARPGVASASFGRGIAQLRLGNKDAALADISAARARDGGIDGMFALLGVIPKACAAASGKPGCPPASQAPSPWQTVRFVAEPDDDFLMSVEIGRLEVMVQQVALLLHAHEEKPNSLEAPLPDRLTAVMARFNVLLPQACRTGLVPMDHCMSSQQHAVRSEQLSQAVDKAFAQIYPVWKGMCRGREARCVIE